MESRRLKKSKIAHAYDETVPAKQLEPGYEQEDKLRDITLVLDGSHPYGLQPWGNFFSQDSNRSIRSDSLGQLRIISDELLLSIFEDFSPFTLFQLAATSKVLYVFSHHEDLWRALVLKEFKGKFDFTKSWRETYCRQKGGQTYKGHHPIKVDGFFSDILYQPWLCSSLGLDPSWLSVDNVERRSNLSRQEFIDSYERKNRPVVITDVVRSSLMTKSDDGSVVSHH
jgi:hypothetical protein